MANIRPRFPHLEPLQKIGEDDLFVVRVAESGQDREVSFAGLLGVVQEAEGIEELTKKVESLVAHIANKNNPHAVTASQLELRHLLVTLASGFLLRLRLILGSGRGAIPVYRADGSADHKDLTIDGMAPLFLADGTPSFRPVFS